MAMEPGAGAFDAETLSQGDGREQLPESSRPRASSQRRWHRCRVTHYVHLLRCGDNTLYQTDATGPTDLALLAAAMADDREGLVRLLRAGADPNTADASGLTPLMWAAMQQSAANIRELLDAGADPRAQDMDGHTALWHSRRRALDFTLPFSRGVHGTIFLPRVVPSDAMRLLAAASLRSKHR